MKQVNTIIAALFLAALAFMLALVLFAPPVSLLLFLAVCGVFDALMPKTFPSIRPPRQ